MFSMAAGGRVKSLIAVTLTLNSASAHHGPGSYTDPQRPAISPVRCSRSARRWTAAQVR